MIILRNVSYYIILSLIKHVFCASLTNLTTEYSNMSTRIDSTFPKYVPNDSDVETCILNNWWDLAKKIVLLSHEQDIDLSSSVRSSVETVQRNSKELLDLLSKHYNELDVYFLFFNVLISELTLPFNGLNHQMKCALQVENEVLNVDKDRLEYSGIGTHSGKRKKYQVNLHLFNRVVGPETKVTPVSMGRFSITLKKEIPEVWNTLNKMNEKVPNHQIWWEMKEKYQEECDKFISEKLDKEL
ncbi:uncharacterized protein TA13150 [Theileria annulata]|uniref:CS domain-containing protein n=1 Tax=Theileria annulata TaxID=5874 RepID=Q4UED7_THEAN|nr:uncharacterized protein TA13150 [Theileria annulata]CAI74552.1 hypothetical protein, conserved [Theileria annulata]|eukprot:XP_952284.1 hypothetical protein, conserved [Theileria annulata]